ncbi:unnamed protein product, partial [marine sediment metagenome]
MQQEIVLTWNSLKAHIVGRELTLREISNATGWSNNRVSNLAMIMFEASELERRKPDHSAA